MFNKKETMKIFNLSNDLINIFTDYAYSLDEFFKDDKNKKKHQFLYNEYQLLNQNLKNVTARYKR